MSTYPIKEKIISIDVDVITLKIASDRIEKLSMNNNGGYVCVSNVHMCIEAMNNPSFANVVNSADLVIPDGKPLSWAQFILGHKSATQVRGQDIMNDLCLRSEINQLNIGLYGGSSPELLDIVVRKLKDTFPKVNITYLYSPPFRKLSKEEDNAVIEEISKSDVDILFVGIGCPKQELWMHEHRDSLNCVMLGVGAAFDFISGSKKHAPKWVQCLGLEWLFRLCSEPKRLWKRYISTNPIFLLYLFKIILVRLYNKTLSNFK